MEKVIAVLCIVALSVTAGHGYYDLTGQEPPGFTDDGDDDSQLSDIKTVTVPALKLKDVIHYDLATHLEFRYENKSSGEWGLWVLDVKGQQLITIPGVSNKQDGFGESHSVQFTRREIAAQFTLFADSSDGEPITSNGEFDVQRNEYVDLTEKRTTLTESNANISVDELQSTNIPLSFRGSMRSYFDVHAPVLEILDDNIWKEGQTVTVDETGQWEDETTWNDLTYEWVVERGEVMAGYDTVFVNISTDLGDEDFSVPFREYLYLANEVPVPIKQYIGTNTSWDSDTQAGYILLENTFALQEGGFSGGDSAIPWGDCSSVHWLNDHPLAEMKSWSSNYMPVGGTGFEDSSFDFKPEDAVDWLMDTNNPQGDGVRDFLSDYPDAIISDAVYNASLDSTDTDGHAGEFWWNLTFGEERYESDSGSSWNLDKRYSVLVYNVRDWDLVGIPPEKEYTDNIIIDWQYGPRGGTSPLSDDDITSQTLTMASSEMIFKTDDMVIDNFYRTLAGFEVDELNWGDGDESSYSLQADSGEQGFGMDLVATLTGIETQTWGKYYWYLEIENLFEGGVYASASVDAETGRLISIVELEGTALQNALNIGG